MRNPDIRRFHTERLRRQGYFDMSPEQRADAQSKSFDELRNLRRQIQKDAEAYAKGVRKDE